MRSKDTLQRARVSTVSREATDLERTFYGGVIIELVRARKRKNYSQEALDHVLGVSQGLVAKWECSLRMPSSFMLVCWAHALDVNLAVIQRRIER